MQPVRAVKQAPRTPYTRPGSLLPSPLPAKNASNVTTANYNVIVAPTAMLSACRPRDGLYRKLGLPYARHARFFARRSDLEFGYL